MPFANDDERAWNLIATGYLALGPKSHSERDARKFKLDVADEQIDAVSQGMLGVTLSCARCHDHKFDPFPTQDYYALAGIFLSSDTRFGTMRTPGNNEPADLIELPRGAKVPIRCRALATRSCIFAASSSVRSFDRSASCRCTR